jgi:hypothetical protein
MTNEHPYLSVVATARNDNHGGNLLRRMQLFVNGLLAQCRRRNLPAELVLVEWNPPADRPRLAEALDWPSESSPCRVRIIEVSSALHTRYQHAHGLPLYQMIGKNVGIRRARGEFVLATNVDILFSDELMQFIARRELSCDRMYRIDRTDVAADVPAEASLDEQLDYCRRNVLRINSAQRTFRPNRKGRVPFLAPLAGLARDFFTTLRHCWSTAGIATRIAWVASCPILLPSYFCWRLWRLLGRGYPALHTNACGDFTLLARDVWIALRGYPELDMYSLHHDSLLCHAAHHIGATERVLLAPMRIFHIEHGLGSGWTPEGENQLRARLSTAGVPLLTFSQFEQWARQMNRQGKPLIFSDDNWGLAQEELPETVIATGSLEPSTT